MYAGVPRALPGRVSALPLDELGIRVRSPPSTDASDFPSGLARPQSTTSVSPCLPTITFARLDVPMKHAPAVGVLDGVADVDEPTQQVAQLERAAAGFLLQGHVGVESLDRLLEAVSPDEPHRVVRPPAVVGSQAVDRDDTRVLQPAGDLRLEHEATAAVRIVGVAGEDLLEGDLAVELGVERDEDGAQAASGVRPEDAEPLALGCGRAHGEAAGSLGVVGFGGRAVIAPGDPCERGLDVRLAKRRQARAVERFAGTAARLFRASPPCASRWALASTSSAARLAPVKSAHASR